MATANNATKQTPATAEKELTLNTTANKPAFDTSKMSVEEMLDLSKKLSEAAIAQGQKEFDSTINFLNEKLGKMGRTKADAVTALITLMSADERSEYLKQSGGSIPRKPRAAKGSVPKKEVAFVRGVTYKDPKKQGKEWTAGGLGAKPKWLKELVDNLPFEEQKKKYAELAAK